MDKKPKAACNTYKASAKTAQKWLNQYAGETIFYRENQTSN
jgi:hypothetical protein